MQTENVGYMGGPFDITASWGMFCADHAQWDLFRSGALMIEDQQTGQCLGQVGINAGPLLTEYELGRLVFSKTKNKASPFKLPQQYATGPGARRCFPLTSAMSIPGIPAHTSWPSDWARYKMILKHDQTQRILSSGTSDKNGFQPTALPRIRLRP